MGLFVRNLDFAYNATEVLEGISFNAREQEILTILGPNGSGKSTMLKCINRILRADNGTIDYNGTDMRKIPLPELARIVSYVPQDNGSLYAISVLDTVLMGRIPHTGGRFKKQDKDIAFSMLETMHIEHLAFRKINQLSGGERQRVIIARALAQQTPILLMDEPTSSLDIKHQLESLKILKRITYEKGIITLLSLHDINLAAMFSNAVLLLKDKRLFQKGSVKDVVREETIRAVYGVESVIHNFEDGIFVRMINSDY